MLHRPASSWGKEGMWWKLGSGKSRLFTEADGGRCGAPSPPLEGTARCCVECMEDCGDDVLHFNILTQEEKNVAGLRVNHAR